MCWNRLEASGPPLTSASVRPRQVLDKCNISPGNVLVCVNPVKNNCNTHSELLLVLLSTQCLTLNLHFKIKG